jgi:hypothetical protein
MGNGDSAKPKARKKIKIILPVLAIAVIIGALALFIKNMNGPAEGTVAYQSSQAPIKLSQTTPHKFDGQYTSFSYPAHFDVTASQKTNGILDMVTLYSNDHTQIQMAYEVMQESLANDSGFNYRKGHPDLYKQQTDQHGNLIFIKNQNGSEYTGFVVHNNLVASISLSSTFNKDLSGDYNAIANSLQWKQ